MELTTLCYVHKEPDKPEERTYFETTGDHGKAYYKTPDISKAMFRPADAWDKTIMAEYEDHAEFWYSQILLVYVEVKEVPKEGWEDWTDFKYIRTIREGEDLLAKYKAKIKELKRVAEEITLDFPVFDGTCYLIRNRQDLVNLVDLYPFNWALTNQLYHVEKIIRTQAVDDESEAKAVEDFRNNFYLPGDMIHDRIELPAVIRDYEMDGDRYCAVYTTEELRNAFETCKRTFDTKIMGMQED